MARPWQNQKFALNVVATSLVTTAETVLATLNGIATQGADGVVNLEAETVVTTGGSTTALVLRIRRGVDTTGAVVGQALTVAASALSNAEVNYQIQDAPGEVDGQSYVVTVQQTGAAGNGTNVSTSLQANY